MLVNARKTVEKWFGFSSIRSKSVPRRKRSFPGSSMSAFMVISCQIRDEFKKKGGDEEALSQENWGIREPVTHQKYTIPRDCVFDRGSVCAYIHLVNRTVTTKFFVRVWSSSLKFVFDERKSNPIWNIFWTYEAANVCRFHIADTR